jgi:hypothetical protein
MLETADNFSLKQLKKQIKEGQESEVWTMIFSSKEGESCLKTWKKKYMYPFGDIAPIKDFEKTDLQGEIQKMVKSSSSNLSLNVDEEDKIAFERIVKQKYRVTIEDMGGLHMCQHWIEEIKKPLSIS